MSFFSRLSQSAKQTLGQLGQKLTAFGYSPPAVPGAGHMPAPFQLPRDQKQEAILRSKEALYGRATYYTGPTPNYISTYPASGLTPERIFAIHNMVLVAGYMLDKACLDEQVMLRDAHLAAVDASRRVASVGKPFSVKPANGSELARHIADYLQAVVDNIDRFDKSMYRLLYANAAGYAIEEVVYENKAIRFPIGKNKIVTVSGIHPRQLDWVTNKCTRFDVSNSDEPLIDMGGGAFASLPDNKFIVHTAHGDFQTRRRGYMYQAIHLHMLKQNAIARWGVVLDIWGIPVPYGIANEQLWQDEKRKAEMIATVQNLGLGKPAVFTDDFRLESSPVIAQGDARGMHAAIIGFINTEQSKLVQGETLTTEIGGVGSYNASETHAAVKESVVLMDSRDMSSTIKQFFCALLQLNMDPLCEVLGATPTEILQNVGRPYWRIEREVTTKDRMELFIKGVNDLGLPIDEDQIYEEFGFEKARDPEKAIPGMVQVIRADAKSVSNAEATAGVENPKQDSPLDEESSPQISTV